MFHGIVTGDKISVRFAGIRWTAGGSAGVFEYWGHDNIGIHLKDGHGDKRFYPWSSVRFVEYHKGGDELCVQ